MSVATAPATSTSRRALIIDALVKDITPLYQYNEIRTGRLREKIEALSDSTLEIVHATAEWSRQLPEPLTRFIEIVLYHSTEKIARETMFYRPHFSNADDLLQGSPTILPFGVVHGLHSLPRFAGVENLDELTGADFQTALAFLDVTAAMHRHTDHSQLAYATGDGIAYAYISDPAMHDLIAAHPDQSDSIVNLIKERKTGDTWLISDCLADGSANQVGIL